MYNHLLFVSYWVINTLVLYLTTLFFSGEINLTGRFSPFEASFYAGFWLTFFIWIWWDIAIVRNFKLNKQSESLTFFLLVNILSLFIISKLRSLTGFSIDGYLAVLGIAVIATFLQRLGWSLVVKRRLFAS